MAKDKKKRKLEATSFLSLSNLTGLDETGQDSIEDCIAEFQHAPQSTATKDAQTDANQEKAVAWGQCFSIWAKGGSYEPGLLPNIEEEIARNFKTQELSKFLLASGDDLRMPMFERWLIDSKFEERSEKNSKDPVLPCNTSFSSSSSQRLLSELKYKEVSHDDATKIVAELCRKTNVASQELIAQSERYRRQCPLKKGDKVVMEGHDAVVTILYSKKKWKKPFCFKVNTSHYEKLRTAFFRTHAYSSTRQKNTSTSILNAFHVVCVAILLRYSAMSGGQLLKDLRGGGMQGAVHEQFFDVLKKYFGGPWMEGFASPMNVYWGDMFGSAFPDIDWHFGTHGRFDDLPFENGGCCEVNPPFSPGVMDGMVDSMLHQLELADKKGTELSFVVIVPTGQGTGTAIAKAKEAASASFNKMMNCTHCVRHVHLLAREHGYIEGSQHLRPTKYKQSSYETSVFVLQSQTKRLESTKLAQLEAEIRTAFESRHCPTKKTP